MLHGVVPLRSRFGEADQVENPRCGRCGGRVGLQLQLRLLVAGLFNFTRHTFGVGRKEAKPAFARKQTTCTAIFIGGKRALIGLEQRARRILKGASP